MPEKTVRDKLTLYSGWTMLGISAFLFFTGMLIQVFGLSTVFPGKRFPEYTETPCMLAFVVLGLIFLNLGVVYRDLVIHPEFFKENLKKKEEKEKKKQEWELIKARVESGKKSDENLIDKGE